MDKRTVLATLRGRQSQLREMGVLSLSLFGSVARDEARANSDIDLAATFDPDARVGMFKFAAIEGQLREWLGVPVDLVGEPARMPRMQANIDRDRARAF